MRGTVVLARARNSATSAEFDASEAASASDAAANDDDDDDDDAGAASGGKMRSAATGKAQRNRASEHTASTA